jgi:iron(II)-dependent oxidoreductase
MVRMGSGHHGGIARLPALADLAGSPAIPSTAAARSAIAAGLEAARARTLGLLDGLPDAALARVWSPIMSPLVWDLAHIGVFEEHYLVRRLTGEPLLDRRIGDLYDASVHPRAGRDELPLLPPQDARDYLAAVRTRALEVLAEAELDPMDPLLADGYVYGLVIQHEHQHAETMLQTLQLSGLAVADPEPASARVRCEPGEVELPGGALVLGAERAAWAFDNERPAHRVELAPFRIATHPVPNRDYAAFVADTGHPPPVPWSPDGAGGWLQRRFGRTEPLPAEEPARHLSWHDADAYARWAGARLPTEAEWEAARKAGALDGLGAVYEWTSSPFAGYPGFRAGPYPNYSAPSFGGGYRVLRGASWAIPDVVARPTYRNWDLPERAQLFAGVRLARDAAG